MQIRATTLQVGRPFTLKATALSHGWHECCPMSWSEGGRCFQIIERDGDRAYRVSVVEGARRKQRVTLRVTIEGDAIRSAWIPRVKENLRLVLGLDQDLTEFYAICGDHPTLHVIPRIGAGRALRSAAMTENIIKALCATNVNWTQAVKMINRIGQLGPPLRHFVSLNAWPTPREILRAGERYLTEVCRLGYRTESILALCRDVCDGRIDPEALTGLARDENVSSDALLAQLRAIRGIGPSSAHYLLSFLGRHDRLAIDSSTIAHVARTHTTGKRPTLKQIERIYAKYGRWKNKVWWYEHWLTWETAEQLVREAGLPVA
ncbi:MAG: hypothetical protein JSU86_13515 [Phycisphaerales bacterium]|nr:MAG: hypothetical protein JSU86_13515 [Phycisphaerales bacterium]